MRPAVQYRLQRGGGEHKQLLWATILIVVLLAADIVSGGTIRAVVRSGAAVLWSASARVGTTIGQTGFFTTRHQLASANAALETQLAEYRSQQAAHAALQAQNTELQALVHLAQKSSGVTAPIISSLRPSPYGTFLIGAGSADGVMQGDAVLTSDGFAVGRVSDPQSHTALVTELFAPNTRLEARIGGSVVTLEGRGGGNARSEAPRAIAIRVGDVVTSPAIGGLPVGVVGHIEFDPASAFQEVYIRVPANLAAAQYMYVQKP